MIAATAQLASLFPRGAQQGAPGDTLLAARDSLAAAAGAIRDTLSEPPLPGGVATIFRFFFQVPQWLQIGGAVLGAVVAAWLLALVWRHRAEVLTWLRTRSREVQLGFGGAVLAVVIVGSLVGMKSWNYMMHENAFCTGCHVMERPFRRFQAGAGKHEDLKCHDCHQQGMYANVRQLVLWVAERPEKIGAHAPVPNARCEGCHQKESGREPWQHVRWLAGHRVHFDSDSSALRGLTCVKCHGAEVHKFIPSTRTCEQSGCHEKQAVKLAGMARLPEINCVRCHAFTKDLPALATRDSAVHALVPAHEQCQSCHEMKEKPRGFALAKDPHGGSCGSCHDPHAHSKPEEARVSCVKCHEQNAARNAFHNGASHRRVRAQCLICHLPHAASVDPSDCVGCHSEVRKRGQFKAPLPFDTSRVLKRSAASPPPPVVPPGQVVDEPRGKGDALPVELPAVRDSPSPPRSAAVPAPAAADSFPHNRHSSLACLTCHRVNNPKAGLVFEAPRGCELCHHRALIAGKVEARDCARCHRAEQLAAPRTVDLMVTVGHRAPVGRPVGFRHDRHERFTCSACHRPPVATPADSVRTCSGCHDQHHAPERDCTQCHSRPETPAAHTRASHTGCDACHTPARIAALVPARSFCLSCHAPEKDHKPGRECSTCHFLESPAEFRRHLVSGSPR